MSARYALGIDLGTTYTGAAVLGGRGPARVVQLSGTSQTIPSVVSISGDAVLAGEAAERRLATHPGETAREFKRRFGDPAPLVLAGAAHGVEVVTAHLLSDVMRRVEQSEGTPPSLVGIAHPASWGPFRLDLLRRAAGLAGVERVELVPEPIAAAVANRDRVADGSLVAVYDLGGGTFDAAVVRCEGDWSVVGTPEGVERLGGIDFDQAIMAHVDAVLDGQVFALDTSDGEARSALSRLRAECQAAKEHLSQDTEVQIDVSLPNLHTSVRLTRAEFEAMVRPRLTDSLAVLDRVVSSADVTWSDIAQVVLVGGSSNIPAVAQSVSEHTGRPVMTATNPHLAVAVGTAMVTGRLVESVAAERAPSTPPVPAAPSAAPPAAPEPQPAGPARSRTPVLVGALVAVLAIVVAAVLALGRGGAPDTLATDGGADATSIDADAEPGVTTDTEPADTAPADTAPADTEPTDTEPTDTAPADTEPTAAPTTAPTTAAVVGVEICAADATGISDIAAVDDGMVLLADGQVTLVDRGAVDRCVIDPGTATTGGFSWDRPVTHVAGARRPIVLAGPDGGALALPGRTDVVPCAPLTGPTTAATETRFFSVADDGIVTIAFDGGACPATLVLGRESFVASSLLASPNRLVAGGTEPDGTPAIRIWIDQVEVPPATADGQPPAFGSVDIIAGCDGQPCVIDLNAGLVHRVEPTGTVGSPRPLDRSAGTIIEVLGTASQDRVPYVLARLDDGRTVIARLVL